MAEEQQKRELRALAKVFKLNNTPVTKDAATLLHCHILSVLELAQTRAAKIKSLVKPNGKTQGSHILAAARMDQRCHNVLPAADISAKDTHMSNAMLLAVVDQLARGMNRLKNQRKRRSPSEANPSGTKKRKTDGQGPSSPAHAKAEDDESDESEEFEEEEEEEDDDSSSLEGESVDEEMQEEARNLLDDEAEETDGEEDEDEEME